MTLTLEDLGSGVRLLSVSRPQALNALNAEVLSDLSKTVRELGARTDIRALIVTGAGEKAFVAGADIKEMDGRPSSEGSAMAQNGQRVFDELSALPFPVIGAVNGFALGGGLELALACDFIVASKKARFGLPEVSLGLIPGYGGTQRLSRVVGMNTARLMAFSGDMYSAEQCAAWGLVSLLTEPDELLPTAKKIAATIASRSPKALKLCKSALFEGAQTSLAHGQNIEAKYFGSAFSSKDKAIGVKAFIEKQPPQFVGE
jgi:enoyl-CoA hydratase